MKKLLFIFAFICTAFISNANVTLPSIFANHMVLQQNAEVNFWGWGKPYEQITIKPSWDTATYKTVTNNQANWNIVIKTPKAGGPYSIKISGYTSIELTDVLIGEVWLVSGQSNMEWSARLGIDNAKEEVAQANYPNIRFFTVNHRTASSPNFDVTGYWNVCSPESMIDFSAAGYFFARELQKNLQIPIAIINSSWGGTPCEVWTPAQKIEENPTLAASAKKLSEVGWSPREPARAYNAMIAPLSKYKIAGTLWYQGESNVENADTYDILFSTLIQSWRELWGYEFPFYFAQIAPYSYNTVNTCGADIRNAQRKVLTLPKTGMIVTADITADTANIHPTNKQDVGKRFAYIALHNHYNKQEFAVSGPLYAGHSIIGKSIVVQFDYAQGLTSKSKKIQGFEIAGADGVFKKAEARIQGTTIIVTNKTIAKPVAVRYAYSNTATVNLYNAAGLPASCFTSK